MHGARKFARDYIAPHVEPSKGVLDVCSGDEWVRDLVPDKLYYCGLDIRKTADLRADLWWPHFVEGQERRGVLTIWPLIVTVYGCQHLLGEEARVWTLLRRIARPDTKFIYIGSHKRIADRNWKRGDPCNRHSLGTLEGLALASGWKIVDFTRATYTADGYTRGDGGEENALAATLAPRGEGE